MRTDKAFRDEKALKRLDHKNPVIKLDNGVKITLEKLERIDKMIDMFNEGQVLGEGDFELIGVPTRSSRSYIGTLTQDLGIDILTVTRGKNLVGWVLANEIL